MYRQPENSNRVKSMKSKFEDLNDSTNTKNVNGKLTKLTCKPPVATTFAITKTENNNQTKRGTNKSKENNENIKIERKTKTMKPEDTRIKNKFVKANGTKDFFDINKKELCNAPPLNLTRQLNDPSKKGCIKRTPAFRKDKLVGSKSKINDDLSFANIVNMFENNDKSNCDTENMTKTLTRTYCSDSEIKSDKNMPKPKRSVTATVSLNGLTTSTKQENDKNIVNKSIVELDKGISSTSTLKISDKEIVKKCQPPNELLDNIVNKQHEKETKVIQPVAYAQVNKPKKSIQEAKNVFLTDTLKAALKQPLPTGPPPKKPPRTFAHTPNSKSPATSTKLQHDSPEMGSTLDSCALNEKLNECFANALKTKNTNTNTSTSTKATTTKIKSDPKLMLQKLENALLNNKIKSPKLPRKLKSTFDSCSKASASGSSSMHQQTTQPNIYTSETPLKNLLPNCLTSLNCVTNATSSNSYTKSSSNASMSTFFTDSKGQSHQEPIYAEPFHFKANDSSESPKSSRNSTKFDTLTSSLHYMSNPVAEWNTTPNTNSADYNNSSSISDDNNTEINSTSNCKSDKSAGLNESGPLTRHKV